LIRSKAELSHQWKESIVLPIHKKDGKTDCSNYEIISYLLTLYKILSKILLSRQMNLLTTVSVGFDETGKRHRSFYVRLILEGVGSENNGTVHQLFIDFKKACNSFRNDVLYSILTESTIARNVLG
jgi:hypothetical protein